MPADADKPVARLQIDTRAYGPLICEECEKAGDECDGEREEALMMEGGAIVCPECRTPFQAFDQFSSLITSVRPVKIKGRNHVCGDRCREEGCPLGLPQEEDEDA